MGRTRVVVVGLGSMGRIYRSRLVEQNDFDVVGVDPDRETGATYSSVDEALKSAECADLWIIATPTASHLRLARQVVAARPAARVLVEKPAGRLDDLLAFVAELKDSPDAPHVRLSDLYGGGEFGRVLRRTVDSLIGPPTRVLVEMSKDRREDEMRGRFVCTDYGAYGYEWFHILRMLDVAIPRGVFSRAIIDPPASEQYDGLRWVWELDGTEIVAASHMDGTIAVPELRETDCTCRQPEPKRSRRLRFASPRGVLDVNLDDGTSAHLSFTAAHGPRTFTRCREVNRVDAVVEAVRTLQEARRRPDPQTSLAVSTHAMLARLLARTTNAPDHVLEQV